MTYLCPALCRSLIFGRSSPPPGEIRVFSGGKYVIKRLELSAAPMWEPNISQWRRTIFWFLLLTEQRPSAIFGSIFRRTLHRKNALLNKVPLPLTSDTVDLIFNLTVNVLLWVSTAVTWCNWNNYYYYYYYYYYYHHHHHHHHLFYAGYLYIYSWDIPCP